MKEGLSYDDEDDIEDILCTSLAGHNIAMENGSTSCNISREPRRYIDRDTTEGHLRLFADYFAEQPTYPHDMFRRRFHMNRDLFCRIQTTIEANDPYFQQRRNAAGRLGLSSLKKVTVAVRMLAYGVAADSIDDYVRIAEITALETLKRFVKAVILNFGSNYLRSPNHDDIANLLAIGEERGFPGILRSIDCRHWKWKNFPVAWHGSFSGHIRKPTIILEAIASYDLWIWHTFFGLPGSFNDINVLDRSPVFSELAQGRTPRYIILLMVVIIHKDTIWLTKSIRHGRHFLKLFQNQRGVKNKHFSNCQESARKDVEHAFGVLQARFKILREPARLLDIMMLKDIKMACIILHNMIVENERHLHPHPDISVYDLHNEVHTTPTLSRELIPEYTNFIQRHRDIRNREVHSTLQSDLVEHL